MRFLLLHLVVVERGDMNEVLGSVLGRRLGRGRRRLRMRG